MTFEPSASVEDRDAIFLAAADDRNSLDYVMSCWYIWSSWSR